MISKVCFILTQHALTVVFIVDLNPQRQMQTKVPEISSLNYTHTKPRCSEFLLAHTTPHMYIKILKIFLDIIHFLKGE